MKKKKKKKISEILSDFLKIFLVVKFTVYFRNVCRIDFYLNMLHMLFHIFAFDSVQMVSIQCLPCTFEKKKITKKKKKKL